MPTVRSKWGPVHAAIGFSENAALGILGHLTDWRGMRISPSLIDDASFAAFANVCDDPVALAGGGTEPRYRCAFSWDLSQQSPEAVLRTFLESCDAEIYPTAAGKVGIRGGGFTAPVVTLDERHIRTYRYSQGNDRLAAFNRLKLTFTHREADYQPVEIDPWEDLASQAEVGVLQQDLTLAQVPSFTQARRLGKIFSAKSNPRHRLTLQTNMGGLLALGERCVHVTLAELDIDDDFLIEKFEIAGDLSGCELQLASLSADSYAWSTAEEGAAPVVPPDSTVSAIPPDVEGVVLSLVRTQISSGAWASKVRASFTPPGGPWPTIGRYRRAGDAAWLEMVADGDAAMITPDVLANDVIYEFQLAHTGFGGVNSANIGTWSDIEMIEVISDPAMINLLPHSDDPDQWDATRVDVTSGALVADPMGGTGGRAITFAEDAGYIYAAGAIEGDLSGRTFTLSVHLRAPAGKAKIMFIAFSDASYLASEITLSGAWQRVSLTATMPPGANHLRLLLDNRSLQGLTDASGGVVEIFGGMIQERFSASAYKSTP
ncbi:MAG: hypothetical protein DI537_31225 [Stutzerimonas stutzeri]|nr:MAG: hypothetical protein DI537_31225 [Stutzerimonas stutzeri]